jgi:photosystem II stability/assembly factor-like uncharacterized protein
MSDYDELDDQLSGALEHAATPADPGGVFDNVVAKKKHRADMRSLRIRGAALLSVVVLAATLAVATSGGSRPHTTHVASGETPTSSQEGDGIVNPETGAADGNASSTTTSVATGSGTHGSGHASPSTTSPGAVLGDGGAISQSIPVTCNAPTRVTKSVGVGGRADFVDSQHGWVAMTWASDHLMSTSDGGQTWFDTLCTRPMRDVAFVDAQRGWVVGDGFILHTTDGGTTWVQQTIPPWPADASQYGSPWSMFAVSFVDAMHGWAVGNLGATLATADGGAHWVSQPSPAYRSGGSFGSVSFPDDEHGWAVGGMGGEVAQSTSDGGQTWVARNNIGYSVDFVDAAHGWAGAQDAIRATTDGGTTWHDQSVPATKGSAYTRIHFVDLQHGWAVSADSGVVVTTDGGAHWQALSGAPANTLDVSFVDPLHGWAVGTVTAVTSDGGLTWTTQISE